MKDLFFRFTLIANALAFMVAVMCLDSDSWIPLVVMSITGLWLAVYGICASIDMFAEEEAEYENH